MADPVEYVKHYDFSAGQAGKHFDPSAGEHVDDELVRIQYALNLNALALKDVRRSDGKLQNGIVTVDSLNEALKSFATQSAVQYFQDIVDARNLTATYQTNALASQTAAQTARTGAEAALAAANALLSQTDISYDTLALFTAATVPVAKRNVRIVEHTAGTFRGGHLMTRMAGAPNQISAWHRQDASGAWFMVMPLGVVSPAVFGARHNDAAFNSGGACQAAIDFAQTFQQTFVWDGRYSGSTQLVITESITVTGTQPRHHGYVYVPLTGDALTVDTPHKCILENFLLEGPKNASFLPTSTAGSMLRLNHDASFGNADSTVDNLVIQHGFTGISVGHAYEWTISRCAIKFQKNARVFVRNEGASSGFMNGLIDDNKLQGTGVLDGSSGVLHAAGYGLTMSSNRGRNMQNLYALIAVKPCHNIFLKDNFGELLTNGFYFSKGTSPTDPLANNTVAANLIIGGNHIQAKNCITDDGLDNGTPGNCWIANVIMEGNNLFPDQDGGIAISSNANGLKVGGGMIDGSTAPNTLGVYLNKDATQAYIEGVVFSVIPTSIAMHPDAEARVSNAIGDNNRYDKFQAVNEEIIVPPASGVDLPRKPFTRTIYVSHANANPSVTQVKINSITVFASTLGDAMKFNVFTPFALGPHDVMTISYIDTAPSVRAVNRFR